VFLGETFQDRPILRILMFKGNLENLIWSRTDHNSYIFLLQLWFLTLGRRYFCVRVEWLSWRHDISTRPSWKRNDCIQRSSKLRDFSRSENEHTGNESRHSRTRSLAHWGRRLGSYNGGCGVRDGEECVNPSPVWESGALHPDLEYFWSVTFRGGSMVHFDSCQRA